MIGLVSFHKDPNYGTMLQAYALAKVIQMHGKECEYINYTRINSSFLERMIYGLRRFIFITILKRDRKLEYGYFNTPAFQGTRMRYQQFHDTYIPLSRRMYYNDTLAQAANDYERLIVGSDQTWSPAINALPNTPYFLSQLPKECHKASYAPSIGSVSISDQYLSTLVHKLKDFEHLSCRERQNCETLSQHLGRPVHYVIDPTLLLPPTQWNQIAIAPAGMPQKYILAYILGEKRCISEFAEKLGREKQLPVYYIVTRPIYLSKEHKIEDLGPEGFLALIRDAAYVVTDSFHGSIFAINFQVNFYSFSKRENIQSDSQDNDRIPLILSEFGLKDRFHTDDNMSIGDDIDFTKPQQILGQLRRDSDSYLAQILQ